MVVKYLVVPDDFSMFAYNGRLSECAMDDDVDMMEYFCGGKKMNPKDFYVW